MPARAALALVLLAAACGGGGSDPEPVERSSVQKQCDSLMSTWCENALACVQDGLALEERLTDDELAVERQYCIDVAKRTCDAAGGVSERFDECQSDVETLPAGECDAIRSALERGDDVAMPEACEAVFTSG
ncbi:MAG TPA: hypothetical protein VFZ53_23285 [Polyangiaceae bacterium]